MTTQAARASTEGLSPEAILERARSRGRELGLPYAGAVTPEEAWALHRAGAAQLVDVRTAAEWEYVGRVPNTRHLGHDSFIKVLVRRLHAAHEALAHPRRIF